MASTRAGQAPANREKGRLFMTVRKIGPAGLVLSSAVLFLAFVSASGKPMGVSAAARSHDSDRHCSAVGGTVMTNFINPSTTLGTATGNLRGAVPKVVLGLIKFVIDRKSTRLNSSHANIS